VSVSLRPRRRLRVGLSTGAALTALAGLLALSSSPAAHANVARAAAAAKPPAHGTIWVTAQSTQSLLEFAPGANGTTTPIADINGTATEMNNPMGLAIDRHGRLWVANFSANMIEVFGVGATGNVAPVQTIVGANTGLNAPSGIAMAQNGDLWVVDSGSNSLAEFAAGAHGNIAPIRTIAGNRTLLANLIGIAVSPDGTRVWITEEREAKAKVLPALEEFAGNKGGNVSPLKQISGSKTKLNDPYGIAVGVNGNDPITDNSNRDRIPFILKFAPGAHGNAAPTVIGGESTGMQAPRLIAIDAVGNIWIPDSLRDLIFRYGPTQVGNVGASRLIIATSVDTPGSVAVFIAPPGVPRAVHAHGTRKTLRITWSAPKVTGGGILGYRVFRSHKKSGPWTVLATTTKRSYTKAHPQQGFFYEIEAFNNGGYSVASHASQPKI
jgi:DNA-binding beta-propeller fold protein YncE